MRKIDLVNSVAKKEGLSRSEVKNVLEDFMMVIKKSLESGEDVYLRGFGSFIVKKRKQKIARDISRGKMINVPEHFIPYFKPSKAFVSKVRKANK